MPTTKPRQRRSKPLTAPERAQLHHEYVRNDIAQQVMLTKIESGKPVNVTAIFNIADRFQAELLKKSPMTAKYHYNF